MTAQSKVTPMGRYGCSARPAIAYQDVTFDVKLNGKDANRLIAEARRRGVTAETLAAMLLATVTEDDMFRAILDL